MNKYTIRLFNQFFSPLLYTLPNWTWSAFFFCNWSWLQITIESFLAMPPSSYNKRNFIPVTVYLRRAGGFTEYGQMLCSGPPPFEQPQRVTFRGVQKWKAFFISLAVLVIRAWDEYILNSLTRMLSLVFWYTTREKYPPYVRGKLIDWERYLNWPAWRLPLKYKLNIFRYRFDQVVVLI